jgi:hypothetical protein
MTLITLYPAGDSIGHFLGFIDAYYIANDVDGVVEPIHVPLVCIISLPTRCLSRSLLFKEGCGSAPLLPPYGLCYNFR